MNTGKRKPAPAVPYTFTNEEIQRLQSQLDLNTAHAEIIGLLDKYSCSFADWSIIISAAVYEKMAQQQQCSLDCKKEQEMLDNLSFLFTKLAYFSDMLSDWHKQLTLENELAEKMIAEGHI